MSAQNPREPRLFIQGLIVVALALVGAIISAAALGGMQ